MIQITEKAKKKIVQLRKEEGKSEEFHVRVSVHGGGCSGLMYDLGFDDTINDTDRINEHLVFDVNNPDSGDLQFRFGLVEGSNDWWWAVDNVEISGEAIPEPSAVLLLAVPAHAQPSGVR